MMTRSVNGYQVYQSISNSRDRGRRRILAVFVPCMTGACIHVSSLPIHECIQTLGEPDSVPCMTGGLH